MKFLHLGSNNLTEFRQLMNLFGEEFLEKETYCQNQPSEEYVQKLLEKSHIVHLAAVEGESVIGGLVAYVLEKFEQERSEVYIYDLAVAKSHRRKGVATALINELKSIAKSMGAWVIFVQADYEDPPAIKLYESLGKREEVLHFDIDV